MLHLPRRVKMPYSFRLSIKASLISRPREGLGQGMFSSGRELAGIPRMMDNRQSKNCCKERILGLYVKLIDAWVCRLPQDHNGYGMAV